MKKHIITTLLLACGYMHSGKAQIWNEDTVKFWYFHAYAEGHSSWAWYWHEKAVLDSVGTLGRYYSVYRYVPVNAPFEKKLKLKNRYYLRFSDNRVFLTDSLVLSSDETKPKVFVENLKIVDFNIADGDTFEIDIPTVGKRIYQKDSTGYYKNFDSDFLAQFGHADSPLVEDLGDPRNEYAILNEPFAVSYLNSWSHQGVVACFRLNSNISLSLMQYSWICYGDSTYKFPYFGEPGEVKNMCNDDSALEILTAMVWAGIRSPESASFSVYPNPVNDILEIRLHAGSWNLEHATELEIYDLRGKLISRAATINPTRNSCSISVQTLNPGIYYFRIEQGNKWYWAKFCKN